MLKVRCQVRATVDAKGRIGLPAPLRRALAEAGEGKLVLTFAKGAIWGWRPGDFEESVESPMASRDPFADEVMDFAHALLAPAQDVDIDNQGRVRIPPLLRELAGVDREVVLNSILNRIEIWDRTAWEERFRSSLDRNARSSGMPRGE
jgi:MraZ protein